MHQIILFSVSGPDQPGLTSALTEVLARHEVRILDIGQANIHDTLTLGFLLRITNERHQSVMQELLFKAHGLGLQTRFQPVTADEYANWVEAGGKPRSIVTVLGPELTPQALNRVSEAIRANGFNIDSIKRLSGRVPLTDSGRPTRACVEFSIRGMSKRLEVLRAAFMDIARAEGIDIAFQLDNVYRRNRRLVVFDMDSTLIRCEVIDELAKAAGVGEQVSRITELAMQGKLDFKESFRMRLSQLKGLDEAVLARIAADLPLTPGAERLIATLKSIGYKTAIISGGFQYFGKHLQRKLGIDYVFANELEIRDGQVTGQVSGDIVDGPRKAELLKAIATREGISLEQVIAVGDGANDLPMLNIAGLGIAFHAKPVVKASARQSISTLGLDGILYLIGLRDRDVVSG